MKTKITTNQREANVEPFSRLNLQDLAAELDENKQNALRTAFIRKSIYFSSHSMK